MTLAHWSLLGSLYTTQSLGLMFFVVALVAILRSGGASLEQISMVYMLGMVWPLKFLWAPLVDRFGAGRPGHYRRWLLWMQGGLIAVLLLIGRFDVKADFEVVYALCLLVALLSATQDIAVDALACRLLPPAGRGMGNGLQIAGGLLGNLLGAGAMLMAYTHIGWQGATVLLAMATAVSFVQLLWFREPRWPFAAISGARMLARLWTFWRRPGGGYWLALLLLYPVGSGLAYALIMPILVDAGWPLERIGFVVNVLGSLVGVLSALAAGWLIGRLGRRRMLVVAAILQIPGVLVLALPVLGYTGSFSVALAVGLYFLLYNPAAAVLATLMMDHTSAESPATDYTLQYSLNQFFAMGMITVGAALAGTLGYLSVVGLAALAALAAVGLTLFYPRHAGGLEAAPAAVVPPVLTADGPVP